VKIAVLSDVHANDLALDAVIKDARAQGCETFWFLGDLTGRGPRAQQTLQKMYELYQECDPRSWLIGNHDMMVLGRIQADHFVQTLGENDPRTTTSLTGTSDPIVKVSEMHHRVVFAPGNEEYRDWLEALPTYAKPRAHFYIAHGAYVMNRAEHEVDADMTYREYTWVGEQVKNQIADLREFSYSAPHVIAVGHSHIPTLWQWRSGDANPTLLWGWGKVRDVQPKLSHQEVFSQGEQQHELRFENLDESPIYFNPGSVGFPRLLNTCPTYVVMTIHSATDVTLQFREVPYDWRPYVESQIRGTQIDDWYPPNFLNEIKQCQGF